MIVFRPRLSGVKAAAGSCRFIYTSLCDPCDNKGQHLRQRYGQPHAFQIEQQRQNQQEQQSAERLRIDKDIRQNRFFRSVKIGCRYADKRKEQHRRQNCGAVCEKRTIR